MFLIKANIETGGLMLYILLMRSVRVLCTINPQVLHWGDQNVTFR